MYEQNFAKKSSFLFKVRRSSLSLSITRFEERESTWTASFWDKEFLRFRIKFEGLVSIDF